MPMGVADAMRRMAGRKPFGFMLINGVWAVNSAGAADNAYLTRIKANYPDAQIIDWDGKRPVGYSLAKCNEFLEQRAMANRNLMQAFNSAAESKASCSEARLEYVRGEDGAEWQIIRFRGTWPDSTAFVTESERLPKDADVMAAARAAALAMLAARGNDDSPVPDPGAPGP